MSEKAIASFLKLDSLVKKEGLTYYRLSKELGYNTSFFSEWKRGKSQPKAETILPLANRLNVPLEYFYNDGEGEIEDAAN